MLPKTKHHKFTQKMINQSSPDNPISRQSINKSECQDMNFSGRTGKTYPFNYLDFLIHFWKSIALSSFLGAIGAIIYLLTAPKVYEATAQIRMAQISQVNPANPFGAVIEDAASLISRMQTPTNYPPEVVRVCGYEGKPRASLELSKALKFSMLKGVPNTVELKVFASRPEVAAACANAVFLQIKSMQEQMSLPFIEEAKTKLALDNERIEAAQKLIARADASGTVMSAAYLSARDEIIYFLTDRDKMIDLINSVKNRGTNLVSPIYQNEYPVKPKKAISLILGFFLGFFLGVLIALYRQRFATLKSWVGKIAKWRNERN